MVNLPENRDLLNRKRRGRDMAEPFLIKDTGFLLLPGRYRENHNLCMVCRHRLGKDGGSPDCVPRAAFIFYFLCAYPAFREGNSRNALAVTEQVLLSGGYKITGKRAGIMALAAGVDAFAIEPQEIEQWLCNNIQESVSR